MPGLAIPAAKAAATKLPIGKIFSGALSLLGLGSASKSDSAQRKQNRLDRQQAQAQFDALMDTSVQRRVADARSAGIHPLFALGASAGASPTMHAGGSPAPRGMTDAIQSTANRVARAQLGKLSPTEQRAMDARSLRDEAEAGFLNSKTAQMGQSLVSRGHDGGVVTYGIPGEDIAYGPGEFFNPLVSTSKRPGVESGTHPAMREILLPDGSKQEIYSPELGLDEIGQVKYVFDRARNVGRNQLYKVWDAWARASGARTNHKQVRVSKKGYNEFMAWVNKHFRSNR